MNEAAAKKVSQVVTIPVVSTDASSPEAQLMRDAKIAQVQTETDTKFDDTVERFQCRQQGFSVPLLGVTVALSLLGLSVFFTKNQGRR